MNQNKASEFDDFIIADEDESPRAANTAPSTSHTSTGASNAPPSSTPFWAPKVDLSTFLPFANNSNAPANVEERQFQGGDTLDEPVWHTLRRDIVQIGHRLMMVVWPVQLQKMAREHQGRLVDFAARNGVRLSDLITAARDVAPDVEAGTAESSGLPMSLDWDLWGPLVFSLGYSVTMGLAGPSLQKNIVFSNSFSFIWFFYFVAGMNIQLLGGSISFLSAISATGYLMFPIVVGAILSTVLLSRGFIRLIIMSVMTAWSIYAALMSLKCSGVLPGRVFLTIYPICLLYMVLAWLAVIT